MMPLLPLLPPMIRPYLTQKILLNLAAGQEVRLPIAPYNVVLMAPHYGKDHLIFCGCLAFKSEQGRQILVFHCATHSFPTYLPYPSLEPHPPDSQWVGEIVAAFSTFFGTGLIDIHRQLGSCLHFYAPGSKRSVNGVRRFG